MKALLSELPSGVRADGFVHTAEPALFGVCADVADYDPLPTPHLPPSNTSVCVFLAKRPGPFVHASSQVVSLLQG